MNIENLVCMANRIGTFFESIPNEDEALHEIFDHIKKYWPPLMRIKLLEQVATSNLPRVHPLVSSAVHRYRVELTPADTHQRQPA